MVVVLGAHHGLGVVPVGQLGAKVSRMFRGFLGILFGQGGCFHAQPSRQHVRRHHLFQPGGYAPVQQVVVPSGHPHGQHQAFVGIVCVQPVVHRTVAQVAFEQLYGRCATLAPVRVEESAFAFRRPHLLEVVRQPGGLQRRSFLHLAVYLGFQYGQFHVGFVFYGCKVGDYPAGSDYILCTIRRRFQPTSPKRRLFIPVHSVPRCFRQCSQMNFRATGNIFCPTLPARYAASSP